MPGGVASRDINIRSIDDNYNEGTETIGVRVTDAQGYNVGGSTVFVEIIDNDEITQTIVDIEPLTMLFLKEIRDIGSFVLTVTMLLKIIVIH